MTYIFWTLELIYLLFLHDAVLQQLKALTKGALDWSDANKSCVAEYCCQQQEHHSTASCNKQRVSLLVHPWEV